MANRVVMLTSVLVVLFATVLSAQERAQVEGRTVEAAEDEATVTAMPVKATEVTWERDGDVIGMSTEDPRYECDGDKCTCDAILDCIGMQDDWDDGKICQESGFECSDDGCKCFQ